MGPAVKPVSPKTDVEFGAHFHQLPPHARRRDASMLIVDANTTRQHLPFAQLIESLRAMFVAGCEVPLRHTHSVAAPDGQPVGTVLLMPAWRPGERLGIKTVTIYPGNSAKGLPGLHAVYTLFDAATGAPLAQLDGNQITARRTAAASALAASYLARPDASRLLIVGAGRVAALMAPAFRAVRPIHQVAVWNRSAAAAHTLAQSLCDQGFDAMATGDLQHAAEHTDIISCATLSTAALICGEWLHPGTHLDLIGSFTPEMRECDAACFARCRVYVDTTEALAKSGDVLSAITEGRFNVGRIQATLAELCRGERAGRQGVEELTLFKSVGTALEDLAAAQLVFDSHAVAQTG